MELEQTADYQWANLEVIAVRGPSHPLGISFNNPLVRVKWGYNHFIVRSIDADPPFGDSIKPDELTGILHPNGVWIPVNPPLPAQYDHAAIAMGGRFHKVLSLVGHNDDLGWVTHEQSGVRYAYVPLDTSNRWREETWDYVFSWCKRAMEIEIAEREEFIRLNGSRDQAVGEPQITSRTFIGVCFGIASKLASRGTEQKKATLEACIAYHETMGDTGRAAVVRDLLERQT